MKNDSITLGESEALEKFSISNLIRGLADKENTAESEVAASLARKSGVDVQGALIPFATFERRVRSSVQNRNGIPGVATRALNSTNFTAGGAFVEQTVGEFRDVLRPHSICAFLGADFRNQPHGDLSLPIQSTTPNIGWGDEFSSAPEADPNYSALRFSPHKVSATTVVSRQLLTQSAQSEAAIRQNLLRTIGTAIDVAALAGSGGVQPIGLSKTPGVGVATFGGPASGTSIAAIEEAVALSNGEFQNIGLAASPAVRAKWRLLAKSATVSHPVWTDSDEVFGRPARASTILTGLGDIVVWGSWDDLVVLTYGTGIDIVADPYTFLAQGLVRIVVSLLVDTAPVHPACFVVSTDSGAQ